jgi:signal transduction histidine kinase
VAGVALAGGLLAVVWLDWLATRQALLTLLRDQASSLRQTVVAAARSNRQAGAEVEEQLVARLLDNARFLAELDRRGRLDEALLAETVSRHGLFRVSVYSPDGSVELASSATSHPGHGRGGGGPRALVGRLIGEGEPEATTEVHRSRWGEARVAAGVRRHGGGAIVLNVDATAAAALERQASLDSLLGDIVASAPEVAYVIFEQESGRIAHGELPRDEVGPEPLELHGEREIEVGGQPVLELDGPVDLGDAASAILHLGMRLDGVRAAERRMLVQLALSLGVSLALATFGVGALWLRRRYGLLSERHARAEAELRRRDRLAAMGELASGVAHEIRNPLNTIAMSVQRLRREFRSVEKTPSEGQERDELLDILDGETRRIDSTVQQFLEYSRPRPLAPRAVDLEAFLTEAGESTRPLAESRGVSLRVEPTSSQTARLDPEQMRQVLDNLLRNAIEATPAGGVVTLAGGRATDAFVITVSDTGAGIESEHLPRIFDLYFTTKPDGTGVGLAVTHQIVTAHGGTLDVESRPGEGTQMIVRVPLEGVGGSGP